MKTLTLPKKEQSAPTSAPVEAPAPAAAPEAAPDKNDLVLSRPTPELNPRNAIMAEIAKRANAQADADAKETVPVADEDGNIIEPTLEQAAEQANAAAEAGEVPAPAPATPAEVPPTVSSAPAAAAPAIDPNADYEIVVDGQKLKIKGTQVLSRVQKAEAADMRLEIATRILAEAKQTAQAQLPVQGAAPAPAAEPAAEIDPAQLAELIRFGTNEQAAEAMKQLLAKANKPAVTPDDVRVIAAKTADAQASYRDATRYVDEEYGDLLKDPYLRDLFFLKDDQARKAGDTRSYKELWSTIGDDMRKHFDRPKPLAAAAASAAGSTPQAANVTTIAQRQAAKAAAPAAPRLASARLEGGDQPAKAKSREEVIEEMRRSRGQLGVTRAR